MRRAVMIAVRRSPVANSTTALLKEAGATAPAFLFLVMVNFSANHLILLRRFEGRNCAVFLMRDDSTRRVYRLYDFTKSRHIEPGIYYAIAGKVNSADQLYLVIESVKRDAKHSLLSLVPVPADGAGGSAMR
jgi:hypothetical protein